MRRYVQVQSTECVYFKSFGDPRVVSRAEDFTAVEEKCDRREPDD